MPHAGTVAHRGDAELEGRGESARHRDRLPGLRTPFAHHSEPHAGRCGEDSQHPEPLPHHCAADFQHSAPELSDPSAQRQHWNSEFSVASAPRQHKNLEFCVAEAEWQHWNPEFCRARAQRQHGNLGRCGAEEGAAGRVGEFCDARARRGGEKRLPMARKCFSGKRIPRGSLCCGPQRSATQKAAPCVAQPPRWNIAAGRSRRPGTSARLSLWLVEAPLETSSPLWRASSSLGWDSSSRGGWEWRSSSSCWRECCGSSCSAGRSISGP